MIKNTLIIIITAFFLHSQSKSIEIRGWNILSDNIAIAEQNIKSARNYDINHLQLSHHLIHNLKEISDTTKLEKINHLIRLAHEQGIENVLIWDHALYEKDYYPKKFFTEDEDKLNLDNEEFWDWLKKDYYDHIKRIDAVDGLVLTFIETGLRIENQFSKLYPTAALKYKKLINELNSVINGYFSMDLVLRTFSYNQKEIDNILSAVNDITGENIYIMIKESNHDFFITHPPNNLIRKINENIPIIVEFDAAHEFSGQGAVASLFPNFHFQKAKHFSGFDNVVGYSARIDRYGNTSIINRPTEINIFAIDKGFQKSYTSSDSVIQEYLNKAYGERFPEELVKIFSEVNKVILSSYYTLGLNTERHSKLNFSYRSIYTRHVSGRWLKDPVVYIQNGVGKKFHYWKDIVNHLAPKKHKSGDGFYKKRSSPNDSISYKILNELEIPRAIENNWLKPKEMMNENYFFDILKEKSWSVEKAGELVELVQSLELKIDSTKYHELFRLLERTLLAAELRKSISTIYYGKRVLQKGDKIDIIINENQIKAKKIIDLIENYQFEYPVGEYNWKEDAQIAKTYLFGT